MNMLVKQVKTDESACKPGSVTPTWVGAGGHPSATAVAGSL